MAFAPKIRAGDLVRYSGKAKLGGPGPYRATRKTMASWTIEHVETGRAFDWVGVRALTVVETGINQGALK